MTADAGGTPCGCRLFDAAQIFSWTGERMKITGGHGGPPLHYRHNEGVVVGATFVRLKGD